MSKLDYHIDQITRKVFRKKDFQLAQLITDWESIIDDKIIATECTPIKINFSSKEKQNGTLILETSSAYAAIVSIKQEEIIQNIARFFGYKPINKIKIIHK